MANLGWQTQRNLENSFAEFIQDAVTTASLTVPDQNGTAKAVSVRVGFEFNDEWDLPVISLYADSKTAPRLSIGGNRRLNTFLLIVDIRTFDKGSQLDLTEWLQDTVNNGLPFYEYTPDGSGGVNKVQNGRVSIDFVTNIPLRLGEGVDLFDKYRQNITLSCTISNS